MFFPVFVGVGKGGGTPILSIRITPRQFFGKVWEFAERLQGRTWHPKLCFSFCSMFLSCKHLNVLRTVTTTLTNRNDVIDLVGFFWVVI